MSSFFLESEVITKKRSYFIGNKKTENPLKKIM